MAVKVAFEDGDKKPTRPLSAQELTTPTLREFTQNTTFHGVKYVFDDTPWFRKLFWALVILGSIVFFAVQVGTRINDYYKYQTVTSLKMISSGKIPFPAVTFCNLNQFRISEAYDSGLYEYLDQQLQTSEVISLEVQKTVSNTSETLQTLGHQFHSLIDSCTWQGRPCDMETDFITRLLDIGICYTFNHDVTKRKNVTQPGVAGGLKLMLNIEEYEHMRGTNLDAGVKFLIHEPGERPALRDLGFVAMSGQHTFVSIQTREVNSLPSPWGNCIEEEGISVADCKHECFSLDFINHCNCTHSSMDQHPNYQTCDISKELTCGCNIQYADSAQCGVNCTCPTPCKYHTHKPILSSSGLSSTNIDMFALRGEDSYNMSKRTFLKAKETRLILSDEHSKNFLKPAKAYIKAYDMISNIHSRYSITHANSFMSALLPFGESFHHSSQIFNPKNLLNNLIRSLDGKKCGTLMDLGAKLVDAVVNLIHIMGIELEKLSADLNYCKGFPEYQNIEFWKYQFGGRWFEDGCYYCNNQEYMRSVPPCVSAIRSWCVMCHIGLIQRILSFNNLLRYQIQDFSFYNSMYYENLGLFADLMGFTINPNISFEKECRNIANFVFNDKDIFPVMLDIVADFNSSKLTIDNFYQFINETYNNVSAAFHNASQSTLGKKYSDVCCWQYKLLSHEYELYYYNGTKYQDAFLLSEKEAYDEAIYRFQSMDMSDLVDKMNGLLDVSMKMAILTLDSKRDLLEIYMYTAMQNYSINQLVLDYIDIPLTRQTSILITEAEREVESLVQIRRVLQQILLNMEEFSWMIVNGTLIPLVFGSPDVKQTRFFQYLLDESTVQAHKLYSIPMCDNMTLSREYENSKQVLLYLKMACSFSKYIERDINNLTTAIKEFEQASSTLYKSLTEYAESTQMDSDFYMHNFMQVDLYYETLQYEVTEEQEAFVIGSLFSEVGGFLGLLLGASVLTMLEIVDYILLVIGQKWNKRQHVTSSDSVNGSSVNPITIGQ